MVKRKRTNSNGPSKSSKRTKSTGRRFAPNIRTAGFLGAELKFFDSHQNDTAITAPADAAGGELDPTTLNCLFAPTQGTGAENRDGRRVSMKSLLIVGNVICASQANQTVPEEASSVFIAVVLDKQTNAAQLNSEDVFHNESGDASLAAAPLRDLERSTRFRVLKTWKLDFQVVSAAFDGTNIEQAGLVQHFEGFIGLNVPVEFVANGGSISDIQDNSLHVIAYCTNTGLAPALNYNARIRFMG